MNIREILHDSGKLTADHAANIALQKPEIIPLLIELAFENEYQFSMRAARVVELIDSICPEMVQPSYLRIIEALPHLKEEGVKRCFLKLLTRHTDIENEVALCTLLNFCFDALGNPNDEVSVRVYAMEIIYLISLKEPDLQNELVSLIKAHWNEASAGFKARGSWIISACEKS